ncbi:GSK3-beta interaction protein-like [Condylostylus longicornis]|uniref:GSK3-beta interaction protein-like n=1 Tax=Condylostylus longicornis TaxID=2530218 RepID=UPI00244DDD64|nr:GSK3-beta interaction protein-like [Condylostylus longicornis]
MQNCVPNRNCASDEEILEWEKEAEAIIQDVKHHVNEIFISRSLRSDLFEIFLNLRTLENNEYCIRASGCGFQIAGNGYDTTDRISENNDEENIFETPYALLTFISPGYVQSFANRLSQQIQNSLMQ